METSNVYVTRDLYEAATLVTLKFPLTDLNFQFEGSNPSPVGYFSFEANSNLKEAISAYFQGKLLVEPRELFSNTRMLKSKVSNNNRSPISGFQSR